MLLGNRLRSQNAAVCEHSMKNVENEARIDRRIGSRELEKKPYVPGFKALGDAQPPLRRHNTYQQGSAPQGGCVFFGTCSN